MNKPNTINNIEFPAKDIPSIKDFYSKVFGWTFTDYGPTYTEFNDGNMVGGFTKDSKSGKNGPLVIIYTDDLENKQKEVEEGGGKISQEIFSFPGGRRFHFKDIEGNELAVWSDK